MSADFAVILLHDDDGAGCWNAAKATSVSAFFDAFSQGAYSKNQLAVDKKTTAFYVHVPLEAAPRGQLQKLIMKTSGPRTMNNSLKLHFFHERRDSRRDFLYGSAIPFEQMLQPQNGASYYGLFNYNVDDLKCAAIPGMRVCVVPLKEISVPSDVHLLATAGADVLHHNRSMRLSNWIDEVMHPLHLTHLLHLTRLMHPTRLMHQAIRGMAIEPPSQFATMRTFARDYGSIIFFQDLHKFFDGDAKTLGSPLPPALAVYALCNALMTHGCSLDELLANMHFEAFRQRLMCIVRDIVAPFTMCGFEGVYWADKSCGKVHSSHSVAGTWCI